MKIFIALFSIFLFAFSIFAQKQAQVTVTSTYLRKEPDSSAEKVQAVQKGDQLVLEKSKDTNGWYYVSIVNKDVKGWIRTDTISLSIRREAEINKPLKSVSAPPSTAPKTPERPRVAPAKPVVEPAPNVEEDEVIRIETEEVNLNVRVVDSNNRAVKNLGKSDFKIYEDGVLQPVTSLNTTEIPTINALVIDNSRSLRSQLRDIIEAGKIIVVKNRSVDESAIIRFVGSNKIDVVQDFTLNKSLLVQGLENLFVEGGQTAIIDAVYLAATKIDQYQKSNQKDDVKVRALILVSDGDDRSSTRDEEQLFELLRNSQVQIYAIGFVGELSKESAGDGINHQEKAKTFLKRLTEETGGKAYFPNSIGELPQIAADISAELHTQYLVSYTPTNKNRGGSYRKINVVISDGANGEKRFAIARTGRISAAK